MTCVTAVRGEHCCQHRTRRGTCRSVCSCGWFGRWVRSASRAAGHGRYHTRFVRGRWFVASPAGSSICAPVRTLIMSRALVCDAVSVGVRVADMGGIPACRRAWRAAAAGGGVARPPAKSSASDLRVPADVGCRWRVGAFLAAMVSCRGVAAYSGAGWEVCWFAG